MNMSILELRTLIYFVYICIITNILSLLKYMPELPEVESIRLALINKITNKYITKVLVNKPKIVSSSSNIREVNINKVEEFIDRIVNTKIINVKRVAKNLILELSTGIIIIHLKMTGQVLFGDNSIINKHTCIEFHLEDNNLFVYNDVRQFGYCLFFENYDQAYSKGYLLGYGIDPYLQDLFDNESIFQQLSKTKKSIKSVFFDQKIICGIGNIYADEISFASHILPNRYANTLSNREVNELCTNANRIIRLAVSYGGSSVSDYRLPDGSKGNYANLHKVYGRKGKDCIECENQLCITKVNGRTTIYCQNCQS
jgi:formamidopyrimidine-DNA glycosylase